MLPDIIGYCLEDGLQLLKERGIGIHDVVIDEYYSPKNRIIGTEKRILKANEKDGKVVLIVGNF